MLKNYHMSQEKPTFAPKEVTNSGFHLRNRTVLHLKAVGENIR